ncbi:hypothetical protein T265_10493 [Opisthorchis viverrini]|uniref:Uncharacterized protein n=1 Tax=Opisthorchis viverrini TaxID=6198 RepID=A0A074Z293_OPIVI|nr:hypothetical protein T265_10493 [Opisthorchis viverrini]KER21113.1 hypothetical protein T265_10493 [Opisthorchis viverrini]
MIGVNESSGRFKKTRSREDGCPVFNPKLWQSAKVLAAHVGQLDMNQVAVHLFVERATDGVQRDEKITGVMNFFKAVCATTSLLINKFTHWTQACRYEVAIFF